MFTAMKKTYTIPQVETFEIIGGTILEASGKYDEGSDGGQLVKERHEDVSGGNGRGGSYNVWGDDWSN